MREKKGWRRHVPDYVLHFSNYFLANIAARAISFLSVPIFTRVLTTSDYGILNLFTTYSAIALTIMTLNVHAAVGRYYYDRKSDDDFKEYVGSTCALCLIIFAVFLLPFIFLPARIATWLELPLSVVILIPVSVFLGISASLFNQIMQPLYKSRAVALASTISAYSAFGLSVIFLFSLRSEKYLSVIWGQLIISGIFFIYYIITLAPYFKLSFKKRYNIYNLRFAIPLIPYFLSGVILAQIDRIMINSYSGFSEVGMYSFAYNIAILMGVVTTTVYQAWIPKYFEYMNAKDYTRHDREVSNLNRFIVLAAIGFIFFGQELGMLLAGKAFHSALNIIPIVVAGYVFEGVSTIYARNIGYSKRNIYVTLIAFAAGMMNIGLNALLLPIYGYKIAAWTTLASYIFMAFLAWVVSIYIIRIYSTPVWSIAKPILLLVPAILVNNLVTDYIENIFLAATIKLLLYIPVVFVLLGDQVRHFANRAKK